MDNDGFPPGFFSRTDPAAGHPPGFYSDRAAPGHPTSTMRRSPPSATSTTSWRSTATCSTSWARGSRISTGHPNALTVLGLNAGRARRNPQASRTVVHDLNADPTLPFDDGSFDAAVCCVSVDYLTRPIEVFREVARVVRASGPFVCTFSNRCFPTKAIRGWLATSRRGTLPHRGRVLPPVRRLGRAHDLDAHAAGSSRRPARWACGATPVGLARP